MSILSAIYIYIYIYRERQRERERERERESIFYATNKHLAKPAKGKRRVIWRRTTRPLQQMSLR